MFLKAADSSAAFLCLKKRAETFHSRCEYAALGMRRTITLDKKRVDRLGQPLSYLLESRISNLESRISNLESRISNLLINAQHVQVTIRQGRKFFLSIYTFRLDEQRVANAVE